MVALLMRACLLVLVVKNMLIGFTLAFFLGCTFMPKKERIPSGETAHIIYFIYTNWHTSILMEAEPVLRHSEKLAQDLTDVNFIRVGWGDGDYFTGKSKRWSTAAKALVASSYSALQVLGYKSDPSARISAGTIVPLAITDEGMRKLATYIDSSIALDEAGQTILLDPMDRNSNLFYRSTAHYSLVTNCNTWSSRALKEAGLPMATKLRLTANSVFSQAKFISSVQREQQLFDSLLIEEPFLDEPLAEEPLLAVPL
jgi:uncharacterized protein (TIGR02117 family)